jgi:deoxyribonuclease V
MKKELEKFKQEQLKLAKKVVKKDDFDSIKLIAGVDQAFINHKVISAIVVCDAKTLKPVEEKYAVAKAPIPYIPGFLSYRESPAAVEAFNQLENKPDILIVDAHGIAHPRALGMASHLGLLLDVPTIGVSRKLMVGKSQENGKIIYNEKIVAQEVITREHARPLYVSIGHRVSLKTAVETVKKTTIQPHKLPEPLHLAHRYANKIREKELQSGNA